MPFEFQREYLVRLPLPLAQLYGRAHNAKDARARHDNTFYLFESLIKLAAAPAVAAYLDEVERGSPRVPYRSPARLPRLPLARTVACDPPRDRPSFRRALRRRNASAGTSLGSTRRAQEGQGFSAGPLQPHQERPRRRARPRQKCSAFRSSTPLCSIATVYSVTARDGSRRSTPRTWARSSSPPRTNFLPKGHSNRSARAGADSCKSPNPDAGQGPG